MSLAKVGATFVALIAGVVIGGGLLLPSGYRVERSLQMDVPPALVFGMVNDVLATQEWSPWKANDPTMEITYGDRRAGPGAIYSWTSENSGEGSVEITDALQPKLIQTKMVFKGMGTAEGEWTFQDRDKGTLVTWAMIGSNDTPILGPWTSMMMDGQVGPMFEEGLLRLSVLANTSKRAAAESFAKEGNPFQGMSPEKLKKVAEAAKALREDAP